MKIMKVITAACTMLLAWCSQAAAQDWVKVYTDSAYIPGRIEFVNDSTGYISGQTIGNSILWVRKTTDGGQTWTPPYLLGNGWLRDMHFPTDSIGYIAGGSKIYKTNDAGNTWTTNVTFNSNVFLGAIYFTSKDTGHAFMENTGNGQFPHFRTYDGGNWWQTVYGDTILSWGVDFPSKNVGYAGRNVYKTIDGGLSWVKNWGPFDYLVAYEFINENYGFVVGKGLGFTQSCFSPDGVIGKTTDGGQTWDTLLFPCHYLSDVCFPTPNHGYVSCGISSMNGRAGVLGTKDAGITWNYVEIDTGGVGFLECTDSITCYVGIGYHVYKTSNGGGVGIKVTDNSPFQVLVYPNPFSTSTTFEITGINEAVTLCIFDQLGREVKRIEGISAGKHELTRDGLSSGFYYYSLHNRAGRIATGKLIVD